MPPYIEHKERNRAAATPATPGELNFAITNIVVTYLMAHRPLSYTVLNDCLGALEGAKLELQRRIITPYESRKLQDHGDVYPITLSDEAYGRNPR